MLCRRGQSGGTVKYRQMDAAVGLGSRTEQSDVADGGSSRRWQTDGAVGGGRRMGQSGGGSRCRGSRATVIIKNRRIEAVGSADELWSLDGGCQCRGSRFRVQWFRVYIGDKLPHLSHF